LPLSLFYRIFDIFLIEGEKTLYRCALAILHYKQEGFIERNDFELGLFYLKDNSNFGIIEHDQFILTMVSKFTFSRIFIIDMYSEYDNNIKW